MLYARVEHKEFWVIIVILLTSMSYFADRVTVANAQVELNKPLLGNVVFQKNSYDHARSV